MSTSEFNIVDVNPQYRENTVMINDNYDRLAVYYPKKDKGNTYYKLISGLSTKYGMNLDTEAERRSRSQNLNQLLDSYNAKKKELDQIVNQITKSS